MARPINKLSAKAVEAISRPGRHSDGGGLYLKVLPDGRRQWVFLYRWQGRQKEMGMGAFIPADAARGVRYEYVTLADARKKATAARAALARRVDPMQARNNDQEIPTFGDFADALIDDLAGGFRSEKHIAQWRMTLGDAYCKALRKKYVNEIDTVDVLGALKSLWQTKQETASRLRGRIERVLDAARAKGLRDGENPARWRGHLDALMPARQKLQRGHHAAMPYDDVPVFVARLRASEAMAARALEFLILTAARSGEVLDAVWNEFDFNNAVWIVPAARMKAGKVHRVPLCDRALEIVTSLREDRVSDFVFPGARIGKPLSNMALAMQMRRMKLGHFTVHGFRSSFRDWAAEETPHAREVAEAALAHVVGDATERAYRRGDALAKRRTLMRDWESHIVAERARDVVKLDARQS